MDWRPRYLYQFNPNLAPMGQISTLFVNKMIPEGEV